MFKYQCSLPTPSSIHFLNGESVTSVMWVKISMLHYTQSTTLPSRLQQFCNVTVGNHQEDRGEPARRGVGGGNYTKYGEKIENMRLGRADR